MQHHALPGIHRERGVTQNRQLDAVLLVQNKGFTDVFDADRVHFCLFNICTACCLMALCLSGLQAMRTRRPDKAQPPSGNALLDN